MMTDDLDGSAAEALILLLEKAPTSMTKGLEDWKIETTNGQNILGKNYCIYQEVWTYNEK